MLNAQEIFDKVARHLFTQGRPAKHLGLCRYRDNEGRSCAVGCLIPDESYDPSFDNESSGGTAVTAALGNPKFVQALADGGVDAVEHFDLLRSLQNVHDSMDTYGTDWLRERLEGVAEVYGLSKDVLKEDREREFKRGDRVRFNCKPEYLDPVGESSIHSRYDGQTVTITELPNRGGRIYCFVADDGFNGFAYKEELEAIPSEGELT